MGCWTLTDAAQDDPDEAVAWTRRSLDVAVGKTPKPATSSVC